MSDASQPLTEKLVLYVGRQSAGDRTRSHGMSKTAIYSIWDSMIQRCENPKRRDYKNYGAKGVKVCDKWRRNFVQFFEDMGHRPNGLSLDRIDCAGNYEPSNCRWATATEQARNQSNNVMIEVNGRRQCLSDWADEVGINKITIQSRLSHGWTAFDAIYKPVETRYSHSKNIGRRKIKNEKLL